MPDNRTITLAVVNSPSSPGVGYTETTGSNEDTYWYLYTGGDGKGGDVTFLHRGPVSVVVQLQGDRRYAISNVSFPTDPLNQLSCPPNSPNTAVIHNKNDAVQVAEYKVTVSDSSAHCTVPCDPKIINQ